MNQNEAPAVSQNEKIREFLKHGGRLTAFDALRRFGCLRLSGRIYDLRTGGMAINSRMVKYGGKHVAEYSVNSGNDECKQN